MDNKLKPIALYWSYDGAPDSGNPCPRCGSPMFAEYEQRELTRFACDDCNCVCDMETELVYERI